MIVEKNINGDTADGISAHLNIEQYSKSSSDMVLFYGINTTFDRNLQEKYKNFKNKILLNLWSPCEFTVPNNPAGNAFDQVSYFDKVYAVCPYTARWINDLQNNGKHKFIFHPFSYSYIPNLETNFKKIYDVCYFGGLHGDIHYGCIDQIKKFNYRFMSQQRYPEVTDFNISYKEKMNIIAQTKISICYHQIPMRPELVGWIKSYNSWQNNKAFSHIDKINTIPQLKARMHEAALCKTLNLVQRDPWNIVERFYEPNKDFYYFNDNSELPYLINNILKSWDYHKQIIESAFNKCLNYGSKETYNLIKEGKTYGL